MTADAEHHGDVHFILTQTYNCFFGACLLFSAMPTNAHAHFAKKLVTFCFMC